MNKERSVLTLGVISSLLISGSLFSALMPITSSFATTSSSCPELPNDGRPQPKKGANEDSQTWKVVRMKGDQSQFKVVDSDGINVADRFHSKTNAEQYIAHFVCATSPPPSAPPAVEFGKEYHVQITQISGEGAFSGDGIAHVNEFPIYVTGGKVGQKLLVKITAIDVRGFAIAEIVNDTSSKPKLDPEIFNDTSSKPVEVHHVYTVQITELSSKGYGIARIQGFPIFVTDGKVGQKVPVVILEVGDRFATAKILDKSTKPVPTQGPKPVEMGKEYDVQITELSSKGDGIARIQGFVIFVKNGQVGENVKIEITQVGNRFATAEIVNDTSSNSGPTGNEDCDRSGMPGCP